MALDGGAGVDLGAAPEGGRHPPAQRLRVRARRRGHLDLIELAGPAQQPLRGRQVEAGHPAGQLAATAGGPHDAADRERLGAAVGAHDLDPAADGQVQGPGAGGVQDRLAAARQPPLGQAGLRLQPVGLAQRDPEGRLAGGGDRCPAGAEERDRPVDDAVGGGDAVHAGDPSGHRLLKRLARGLPLRRAAGEGVQRRAAHDQVGLVGGGRAGAGGGHRPGERERPGDQGHAEGDGQHRQPEPELVGQQVAPGRLAHRSAPQGPHAVQDLLGAGVQDLADDAAVGQEHQVGLAGQGPGHGHPLLLAAGQLRGPVVEPVGQPGQAVQQGRLAALIPVGCSG